ncbi:hypothetical protein L1987_23806 [Smallanthus sonchifolius]|uniref:Uncharacterized protein n=1 Tax=Smallanthus sonchifolius TaxID=185202 RepID=A0ACB9IIQ2_9ASTR|nr:hypothetical protein L1987_23806 [Smallanthus sonchifolius]
MFNLARRNLDLCLDPDVIASQNEKKSDRECEKGKSISEDVGEFVLRNCDVDDCLGDFDVNENGDEGYIGMSHMYPYIVKKNSNFIFIREEKAFKYKHG